MDEKERARRIQALREELSVARSISQADLAGELIKIGFSCRLCGECGDCCKGSDNSVLVFPREVRGIMALTGLFWHEVAVPPDEGEWDRTGSFHTLEWRLRKDGDSCRFYKNGSCEIYAARPILCRTYPFYLESCKLMCSECRGLGGGLSPEEAERMARDLISRQMIEIEETIALLELYRDFERGGPGPRGIIVHDSEGEHRIEEEGIHEELHS